MTRLYCDTDQDPLRSRRLQRVGCVWRMTWPKGHTARTTPPMWIDEAIMFFDPFQKEHTR